MVILQQTLVSVSFEKAGCFLEEVFFFWPALKFDHHSNTPYISRQASNRICNLLLWITLDKQWGDKRWFMPFTGPHFS
jgi:hypothetical protein